MSPIRILIVEDEPLIAEDLAEVLGEMKFRISEIVHSSDKALQELKYNTPDLVLLDIELNSKLDGVQIAEHINAHYRLPFVFLTSFADRSTIARVQKTQPMGYIVKPFNEKNLLATIEIALYNFREQQKESTVELTLETINQQVHTPLTKREFEILKLIYAGKTNKELSDELFVSLNTIKTHISNLYLKLDATSRATAITRVRNMLDPNSGNHP